MKQLAPLKQLDGQHIVATVQAESDGVYDNRKELSFDASHLHVQDLVDTTLPGQLLIAGFGEPAVYIANLLIVPLVPIAILLALVAGLGGTLLPVLGGIIATPARIILSYMLDLVQRELSLLAMLFLYGCLGLFVLILWRSTEKRRIITDTNTGE